MSAAAKQAEALRLRAGGMDYDGIAARLGYKNRAGAHKAVMVGLQRTLQEPADELRTMEAERLDRMLEGLWEKAIEGHTWSVDRVLNIMERRAKLLGLDKPPTANFDSQAAAFLSGVDTVRAMQTEDMSEGQPEASELHSP